MHQLLFQKEYAPSAIATINAVRKKFARTCVFGPLILLK